MLWRFGQVEKYMGQVDIQLASNCIENIFTTYKIHYTKKTKNIGDLVIISIWFLKWFFRNKTDKEMKICFIYVYQL